MINKILYYYIRIELLSPLSIGNGTDDLTDHDIIKDNNGIPYIPGSSLAGVIAHYLSGENKKYFAPIKNNENIESPYFISDATIVDNFKISIRDGIKLDENKITEKGAKYDFEILEPGSKLDFRIEITNRDEDLDKMKNIIDIIINGFNNGDILLGFKSKRGYGKVRVDTVKYKEFSKDNINDLLEFGKYDISNYDSYSIGKVYESNYDTIKVELKQLGGINIRRYSAKANEPDFEHIKTNGKAVIPGTSWSGLFRSTINKYVKKLMLDIDIDEWFGYAKENNKSGKASDIIFEESIIENGKDIRISRTKIDRFSGGASNRSLFTEKVYFNGNTELNIKVKKEDNIVIIGLISLVLKDLDNGFISLGGETSIGRGLFKIISCTKNNQEFNLDECIRKVLDK